jgi:hypothetical protein
MRSKPARNGVKADAGAGERGESVVDVEASLVVIGQGWYRGQRFPPALSGCRCRRD